MKLARTFFVLTIALALEVQCFDIAGFELPDLDMPEMPELEMPELELPELPELDMPELPDLSDITGMLNPDSVADIPSNVPDIPNSVSTVQDTVQSAATIAGSKASSNNPPSTDTTTAPSTTTSTTDSSASTTASSASTTASSVSTTASSASTTASSASTTASSASTTESSASTTQSSSTTKAPSKTTLRDFSSSLIPYQSTNVKESVKRCAQNLSITADEILAILRREVPTTEDGECFLACIKKENGLITEDNKYNMTRVKYTLEPVKTSNEKLYDKVVNIFDECKNAGTKEEDDCEAGKKLRICVQEKRQQLKATK